MIVLRRRGLLDDWTKNPASGIATLHDQVVHDPAAWPELFALAELSYQQGRVSGSRPDFLAAALYAYAFLFPAAPAARPSPFDPHFRQACDLYNLALTEAFTPPDGGPVPIAAGRSALPFGAIDFEVDPNQLRWGDRTLVSFQPTSNLAVDGMQNIYRAPGLGAPLAAMTDAGAVPADGFQIAPLLRVPTNMLLEMDDPRYQIGQPVVRAKLVIHEMFDNPDTGVGGQTVPLEYNQTAARALSLVEAAAWTSEYEGLFDGTLFDRRKRQLVALTPHQHGRMPVVFVHGTASSPFRWADMVNDLLEDPMIRDHFEFWFFAYATGNPIPYSALQLRQSIADAVQQLGGVAADPALGQITLIGHSQGGLLAKMLVINPGDRLWNGLSRRPLAALRLTDETRALLRETLFPHPVLEVQRVIFIATPQRGSYLADFSIAQWLNQLFTLPLTVSKATVEILKGNGRDFLVDPTQTRMGSIYGMSPNGALMKVFADIPVAPSVHAHSIIAVQGEGPPEQGGDGVVRYSSAHIDGVDSEIVVRSGHSTQANPATIAEVRRILLLQLRASAAGTL